MVLQAITSTGTDDKD